MGAERDELVKRTFPALRKLCESRGVTWGEVDLRWGITDEQKAEGQVLPICLAEIARCRPYFIGLLGERYGWVPDQIEPAAIEAEPWLSELAGHSVTELEILHGVLRDPAMTDHAFFYLRDPAYAKARPAEQYRETAGPQEIASLGAEEADRRAADRRTKLAALKDRIRGSGLPLHDGYPDPPSLGELVLADLTAVIENLYPAGSEPDPLTREAAEHEAFARSRSGVYIGRREYYDRLDAHAAGDGAPLVIVGDSGSGKSALLANWALAHRAAQPQEAVLMHFIGASAQSADWAALLRRLMAELKARFELTLEIPEAPDALRLTFANALHMAAAKGRIVLVIDALNQLDDREGALDLTWLPAAVPANVRLVVSTLPGRALAETQKRGWPSLAVSPLEPEERERLIVDYLAGYSRALGPALRGRIASAAQCANPLYLRALLDELRVWGEHETLGERIDHYLSGPTVEALFELILARYEADYERDRAGLVRDAFSLLWAARRGLSEAELLDLLGTDGRALPRAYWSPLYLAAETSLTSRSGLLGFFHDYLRAAVEHHYLPTEADRTAAHLRLADYFAAREIGPRKIGELPWQLAEAKAWQRLADLLADLTFLQQAWIADEFSVKTAWAQVERNSSLHLVDAYQPVLEGPVNYEFVTVFCLAGLLGDTGHPEQALALDAFLVAAHRLAGDVAGLQIPLGNQANILHRQGDLGGAMALYKEQERICRELGDPDGLQISLGNQATILSTRGDLDNAMALMKEQERICRELGALGSLAASLGNQANIIEQRGDLDGAMALHKEEEQICRELGNPAGLQRSLGNQANILRARGDLMGAMTLGEEQERICRDLGDPGSLAASLCIQAAILHRRGDLDGAMAVLKEAERISRELGDQEGLQRSLGNQALILQARGDVDGAMAFVDQGERISRALGDLAGLQASLINRAGILQGRGDLDGAMAILKEVERVYRELGDLAGLQRALGNQGVILKKQGDPEAAMVLFKEQERICREFGDPASLQISLGNQGVILEACGDLDGAMALHKEQERISRELGDPASLQISLGRQAAILKKHGDLDGAMALHKEQERICSELGDPAGLRRSLEGQAVILEARGDLDGALALRKEQERICRESGDMEGLARSLTNRAILLGQVMGRPREALPLAEEAFRLASQHGLAALAGQIRPIVDRLRRSQ